MRDRLAAAGASVEFHVDDGADHVWLGAPDAAVDALDRTVDSLNRELLE